MTLTIACACNENELAITGEPVAQFYCHCRDCRRMHGGAYTAESVYPASAVEVVRGTPARWTLARNPRFFCGTCGQRTFIEIAGRGLIGVNGLVLPEGAFRARFHVNCATALVPVPDGLTHYAGMPALFGGSDDIVTGEGELETPSSRNGMTACVEHRRGATSAYSRGALGFVFCGLVRCR